MKKILMLFTLISSIAILLILGAAYLTSQQKGEEIQEQEAASGQQPWLTPEVIPAEKIEKKVKKALELEEVKTVYDMAYQNAAQDQVDQYKKAKSYSLQEPLLILNPYGTNRTGLYIYFQNKERVNVEYEVSVKEEGIGSFTGKLYTNQAGMPLSEQEGQIIGLIQGQTNYVILRLYDADGNQVGKAGYKIEVPDYGTIRETKLEMEQDRNTNQLTDGLYCLFGYDRRNTDEPKHILFYDNQGIIRAEIPVGGTVQDVKLGRVGEDIFYACGVRQFAQVNRLGKVVKVFTLGKKYRSHHDFEIIETIDKVLVLADELSKETKEDVVLALDLYTGEVTKVLDFEELMPDIRKKVQVTEDSVDADGLDWIHLNSISVLNETDILLSSRETSTIIRVNHIFEEPELAWFLAEESVWEGTKYEELLLTKEGDFPSQAGQHTVTCLADKSLEAGQYYVYLFNNNYGESYAYPEQKWSVIPGVGLPEQAAANSYYYRYLIDENAGTYQLVQKISLPYSRKVSSVQHYQGNIVTCSGMAGIFEEYNADGKRIARYFMEIESLTYRVFKYDMKGYWFANE